jgi:hypothetical protein
MTTQAWTNDQGLGMTTGGSGRATASRIPAKPSGAPAAGRGTGSQRLDVLVKNLETVQLSDQHDLHQACEAFRMLGHRLAMEAMMMSGELEEGAKAMAKSNSLLGIVGPSARLKIRRTVKAFRNMADSFAAAGGSASSAWHVFNKDFADDLSITKTKPAQRRGFTINPS